MLVPKKYRRVHSRALRRIKATPEDKLIADRDIRIWQRCVRAATEEAMMGIGM